MQGELGNGPQPGIETASTMILGFLTSRTGRSKCPLFISHPVCGISFCGTLLKQDQYLDDAIQLSSLLQGPLLGDESCVSVATKVITLSTGNLNVGTVA